MVDDIVPFLSDCRTKTYAAGVDGEKVDGSTKYSIKEGNLEYRDIYFDQRWVFEGQEIIFSEDLPIWSMSYRGAAVEGTDTKEVFGYLQKILKEHADQVRLPGSKTYNEADWRYVDKCEGTFDELFGEEQIFFKGQLVHRMKYFGGKIV